MLFVVLLAALGSHLIFINNLWARLSGSLLLLGSFGMEFYALTRIDLREDFKKAKEEISELVDRAEEISSNIEETASKIEEIKKKVFGWHNPAFTFKSLKEELEEIKKHIGARSSLSLIGSTINERIKKIEESLEKVKRKVERH